MKRKYRRYTKEYLEPIVLSSLSYAECLRKMDLIVAGGNYSHLQDMISRFNIDTSHMTGMAHNRDKELIPFEGLKKPHSIKSRLIKERGYLCEECKLDEWRGQPIALELEHIDGNNRNNSRGNLKLLCPNCHSQTPTWRRRKS